MRKLALLPLLLLTACFQPECDCDSVKNGKFQFDFELNGQKKTTIFERNADIEIENFDGKIDTSSVKWVGNCEYVLQKKHPKNQQEKKAVAIKILTTSKDGYTFEFGLVGSNQKQKGTAKRIK